MVTCPYLDKLTDGIKTDWINQSDPTDYGIYNGGDRIVKTYMGSGTERQLTFYLQSSRVGAVDAKMIKNSEFIEKVQNWINDRQTLGFAMPDKCFFTRITAGNGIPLEVVEGGNVYVYRITGNINYKKII